MSNFDLIDYLMMTVERGSSDLHLTAGSPPMIRVSGSLEPLADTIITPESARKLVFDVLKETQRSHLDQKWQLDFAIQVDGVGRFRGNACFAQGNIRANFRYIPEVIPDLATLGHSPVLDHWCDELTGLLLITGSSGSGKSTTLASMTQTIANRRRASIVSIEDPIEYLFPQGQSLVDQREVGTDAASFSDGLRNALRQDADVILIGELRDPPTIHTALTAAETGHLVIATLHTTDAPAAIGRILDAFPADQQDFAGSQLAWSLLGVVCQYLLPRAHEPGMVLATEIMRVNSGIEACIRDKRLAQIPGLIQIGGSDGMHTVDSNLMELLRNDQVHLNHALSHARDPKALKEQFQQELQDRRGWLGRTLGA